MSIMDGILQAHSGPVAAGLLAGVRSAQRLLGPVRGACHTWQQAREVTGRAYPGRRRGPLPAGVTREVATAVLARFLELCRRQCVPVDDRTAACVLAALLAEVAENADELGLTVPAVVPATVYNGSLGRLRAAFPEFSKTPGLFRKAAVCNPFDPHAFLIRVREATDRLAADPRFSDIRLRPSWLLYAASSYPTDPEAFLLSAKASAVRLAADPRFADFRDTPQLFWRAAVQKPKDPESLLLNLQTTVNSLLAAFPELGQQAGIIRHIALNQSGDPMRFLRQARGVARRLAADDRFAAFRDAPGAFWRAAVYHPSDPEEYLALAAEAVARLGRDWRFRTFRATPFAIRYAALFYPDDPGAFLADVAAAVRRLGSLPEFAGASPALRGRFLQAALYHPSDPEGYLRSVGGRQGSAYRLSSDDMNQTRSATD